MLHMKHRHVLMNRHFEPTGLAAFQERLQLTNVQVIRCGESLKVKGILEIIRGQMIGHVQRVIAHLALYCKKAEMIVVANEVTVRRARADEVERPFLAHFEYTRWRHKNG